MQYYTLEIPSCEEKTIFSSPTILYGSIVKSSAVSPLYRNFLFVSHSNQNKHVLVFQYSDAIHRVKISEVQLRLFKLQAHQTYRLIKVKSVEGAELYAIEEENGIFSMCRSPRMHVNMVFQL
jgi:hypothetical protein